MPKGCENFPWDNDPHIEGGGLILLNYLNLLIEFIFALGLCYGFIKLYTRVIMDIQFNKSVWLTREADLSPDLDVKVKNFVLRWIHFLRFLTLVVIVIAIALIFQLLV